MESVKKRKRAVAYVRVSSGSEAQIHSFEFQSAYWHNELDSNPDVEMVGIYADKGINNTLGNREAEPAAEGTFSLCDRGLQCIQRL